MRQAQTQAQTQTQTQAQTQARPSQRAPIAAGSLKWQSYVRSFLGNVTSPDPGPGPDPDPGPDPGQTFPKTSHSRREPEVAKLY